MVARRGTRRPAIEKVARSSSSGGYSGTSVSEDNHRERSSAGRRPSSAWMSSVVDFWILNLRYVPPTSRRTTATGLWRSTMSGRRSGLSRRQARAGAARAAARGLRAGPRQRTPRCRPARWPPSRSSPGPMQRRARRTESRHPERDREQRPRGGPDRPPPQAAASARGQARTRESARSSGLTLASSCSPARSSRRRNSATACSLRPTDAA